ncbi:hypothetical protein JTB14_017748 [Gonioctena quinquepunctata]|nr:hypothetical protein JTB14_017748 [Gonioctena quinquepunctata]
MNNFNEKLSKPEEYDASMYNNAPQGETQEIDEDRQNLPQRKTVKESSETDTADEEMPNRHDLPQGSKSNHSETDTADEEGSNQTVHTNHENPTFENENAPCRNINPGYLCHSNSIQYDTTSKDCIAQILRLSDDAAFCQHVPVTINTTTIEQLTPELTTGYGFKTPRDAYINSKKVIREQPLTLPKIQTVPVHPKEEIKPIHLEKIPLDELHKLHDIQDHMTPLFYEQDSDYTHLWITPVYNAIAASVGILCFKYYHCLPCQKKATTTPSSEPPVLFVPYKTSSGDGEVTK